jgi:hypothetical protein
MLALARRSVVTERVDTLLKVGLGPLGKVEVDLLKEKPHAILTNVSVGRLDACQVYWSSPAKAEWQRQEDQRFGAIFT